MTLKNSSANNTNKFKTIVCFKSKFVLLQFAQPHHLTAESICLAILVFVV